MIRWLLSLFRRSPKPRWEYIGCEYHGIDDAGCHVYVVSSRKGDERQSHVHRFHAQSAEHRKSDVKMDEYFRRSTDLRNEV